MRKMVLPIIPVKGSKFGTDEGIMEEQPKALKRNPKLVFFGIPSFDFVILCYPERYTKEVNVQKFFTRLFQGHKTLNSFVASESCCTLFSPTSSDPLSFFSNSVHP